MKSKGILVLLMVGAMIFGLLSQGFAQMSDAEVNQKIDELLAQMTLEEKVGQMTQVTIQYVSKSRGWTDSEWELDEAKLREAITENHIGSLLNVYDMAMTLEQWDGLITKIQDIATKETRLGIPVLYGIDAIHGGNYIREATLFPQSIAMAATRNPELVKQEGHITAKEIRAAGLPWNFNPVLGLGRNPLWPRHWETYGEDPYLATVLGVAYIDGQEGENNDISQKDRVAACMKHYVGYSVPLSGKDRTPAWIPERMLRDIFLRPFEAATEAGVHTVMINSGEINGIPTHSDVFLLTQVLRDEWGFEGLVVTDWHDIINLYSRDKVASSEKEAVKMAVMAGIDMSMVPYDVSFYHQLLELVNEGEVPVSRIDEAVSRILWVKYKLDLFENPYPIREFQDEVGSDASAQVSLQAAREAITLLKNDANALPLAKDAKVLVTGPTANMRSVLNSGWSYVWQGNEESLYPTDKKTILEAVQAKIGEGNVTYVEGAKFAEEVDITAAVEAAKNVDAAIVCLGEYAYCETPGNIHDLSLPHVQWQLANDIAATGTPVIVVLAEGRPRIITPVVDNAKAIVQSYLPGPEGGLAIADVLFGDFNPCGKLPYTYPKHVNDLVTYDHKPIETDEPNKMDPLYPFGHGLSYTTFEYSDLTIASKEVKEGDPINVSVTVTNTGDMAGMESVELYLSDLVRSVTPPVRQLKRFTKVDLEPGASQTVEFTLTSDDLNFYNRLNEKVVEPGEFQVAISELTDTFVLK